MANGPQSSTLEELKAIVERAARPEGETNRELLDKLRPCEELRPDQLLHLYASAVRQYDEALQRNIYALSAEQRRLGQQIVRLRQEMANNREATGVYHRYEDDDARRSAFTQVVFQRVKMDDYLAELEKK